MSIADKLITIAENVPKVFEAGRLAREKEIGEKIYIAEVAFDDTNSLTVELPFKPDKLVVFCFDAIVMSTGLTYYMLSLDNVSFSQRCAVMGVIGDNLAIQIAGLNNSTKGNFFTVTDTSVKFTPPTSSYWGTSLWRRGAKYSVLAYRSGKSERELLEEEISALPAGGGSIKFSQSRVLSVVTESEWEDMIAPARANGWTFAFV